MPFSLISQPGEMNALRKISDAAVIHRAIHTIVGRVRPEFRGKLIESGAKSFLDQLATSFQSSY